MADVFPIRPVEVDRVSPANDQASLRLPLAKRPDFSLGTISVRPSRLTLDGPSGSVQLERRMMEVLLAFTDADGAVLTREDLMALCWPGVTVGEDSVNRVIGGVRKAAAEVGGGFTIETVPRIGYRLELQGDVSPGIENGRDMAAASDLQSVDSLPGTPVGSQSRRWLLAGGAAVLSVGGIGLWVNRPPPVNPEVTRMMEESRVAMRLGTSEAERHAIALLERAVVISPDSADAWGLLALTRARGVEHALTKPASPTAEVDNAAQRALQLDKNNSDAMAALAIAIPYYGDWLAAERRFDAVLAKNPRHLVTRDSRSFFFGAVGRMRESAQERLAFSADASFDAGMQFRQIYSLWFLGRIEEADRVVGRGMEMWPRHAGIWFGRLWVLADTGRFDRALAHIDDESARPKLPPPMIATLRAAIGAAKSRQPNEIAAASERVMGGVGRSVAAVINAMMLLNLMGATDRAFDLANAYYLEQGPVIAAMQWRPGQPDVPDQRRRKTNMLFTPTAAAMRRDPRFMPLVKQIGLTDYWDRRGVEPDFLA